MYFDLVELQTLMMHKSFKIIGLLDLEKKILKDFTIYEHIAVIWVM